MQTAAGLRAAVAPKLVAAQAMSSACSGHPITQWALFSSLTALLGSAGQGNYAAANAQLNAWADAQQHAGARLLHAHCFLCVCFEPYKVTPTAPHCRMPQSNVS